MTMLRISIAALCLAALPMGAIAEKGGNGNGNREAREARGNSAEARAERGDTRVRGNSANARANPSTGFCPPGLRDGDGGCVPPGQAAKGVTAEEWAAQKGYRYVPGAVLTEDEFVLLENYADYDLPDLAEGEVYAVIDRTAVVIDPLTLELLRLATR